MLDVTPFDRDEVRWRLGIVVFNALSKALEIPGVDAREIARAFSMAAAVLVAEPEMDADAMNDMDAA
jgi:hypothetical protein